MSDENENQLWPNCHEVQCEQAHESWRTVMTMLGLECPDNIFVVGKAIRVSEAITALKNQRDEALLANKNANGHIAEASDQLAKTYAEWGKEKLKRIEYSELLAELEGKHEDLKQRLMEEQASREQMRAMLEQFVSVYTGCGQAAITGVERKRFEQAKQLLRLPPAATVVEFLKPMKLFVEHILAEHSATMREVSEIGHSDGLCLTSSLHQEAHQALAMLKEAVKS